MKFTIDLDKNVEERYSDIVSHYNIKNISKKINDIYDEYITSLGIPFLNFTVKMMIQLNKSNIMYRDELQFWSNKFNMPFHKILILQLLYEINSGCTTFVYDRIMYRTMDWPIDFLKEITYHGIFVKNNKMIYEGIGWIGSVGLFTAKTLDYAISINYRRINNVGLYSILKNLFNIITLKFPVSYLVRYIVENQMNTSDAINILKKIDVISPVYYTINVFDGIPSIIERDSTNFNEYKNEYVIQTNCDLCDVNNMDEDKNIMNSYERYNQINQMITKKLNKNKIIKTFNKYPIMNEDTIYFCTISKDSFELYI